jgi:hypothetical protein
MVKLISMMMDPLEQLNSNNFIFASGGQKMLACQSDATQYF